MKQWLSTCLLFWFCQFAFSQPFGNEWIDYDQRYLRVPIWEQGLYRISGSTLTQAFDAIGVDLSDVDPRSIQVFSRGEEQYIYVSGASDGIFNTQDYLEFYGEPNDGWLDSLLHESPEDQANPYLSLFTDTANYFITWNNSVNNRRLAITSDINFSSGTAANYVYQKSVYMNPVGFLQGEIDQFGKSESYYMAGKGWFDQVYTYLGSIERNVETPQPYTQTGAPLAKVDIVMASASNASQFPDHHLKIQYGASNTTITDTTFDGYNLLKFDYQIPTNTLSTGQTQFTFTSAPLDAPPASDRMALGYVAIEYPRAPTFTGETKALFEIPASSGKTHLTLTGLNSNKLTYLIDLGNNQKVTVLQNGGTIQALLGPGSQRQIYLSADNEIQTLGFSRLVPAGNNGSFTDFEAAEVDSAYLVIHHPDMSASAAEFASYRSTGGQTGIAINVEELYQQYAYGVWKTPLAIRNFADHILSNWTNDDHLLFLLGKSISNHKCRFDSALNAQNLVPSFGWPSADNALTAGLHGTISQAAIPTGRLAAHNDDEALIYLQKVKDFESNKASSCFDQTIDNKRWMKNVLHFGGGTNSFEQSTFRSYLGNYSDTITTDQFGGQVYSFYKSSADPIQSNLSDSINLLINQGVSLITFFGHSSGGTFDISVDHPSAYENYQKYPLILANSCFSGDIHGESSISQSEQFVLIKDKGSIGFLASTHLGFASHLNTYSRQFYTALSKTQYGQCLGKQMQTAASMVQNSNKYSLINTTAIEMTLHGDPAIVLNAHDLPDYALEEENVFFDPADVTTDLDKFNLNIIIDNIGKAIRGPLVVTVEWEHPDGTVTTYNKTVSNLFFSDTVSFEFEIDLQSDVGLNQFAIALDRDQLVDELCDLNNVLNTELWITSADLIPIYPYNYAVVPDNNITLKASSSSALQSSKTYRLEIDTVDTYDSPKLNQTTIVSSGGVISWEPGTSYFNQLDSAVYFWRASPDATFEQDLRWREHSFQIINDRTGWGQDHFFQFKNDDYLFIQHNRQNRKFEFVETVTSLRATVYGNPSFGNDLFEFYNTQYTLNGAQQEFGICGATESMIIAVIDSLTHIPWGTHQMQGGQEINADHAFGNANSLGVTSSANCRSYSEKYFLFPVNDPDAMDAMANMLTNEIPDGSYILAYTGMRAQFEEPEIWQEEHFAAFEALGADSIRNVPNSNPYIFFCQKGKLGSVVELVGEHTKDVLTLDVSLYNNLSHGEITSTLVGPASEWGSLHWLPEALESGAKDDVELQVFGSDGTNETLLFSIDQDSLNVYDLSTLIDANTYPYLRLKALVEDDSLFSSTQLDRWHVLYTEQPEIAINPLKGYHFYSDTLTEGESGSFSVAIENISQVDMPSYYVKYWILDQNRKQIPITSVLMDSLKIGQLTLDTLLFPTQGLSGDCELWMEVNPQDSLWRGEQFHFNNVIRIPFHIGNDRINPVMDVTFDGMRILDGEIVSPQPDIVIWLKDENNYLAVDDTTAFKVFLQYPDGSEERIWFVNAQGIVQLEFEPASLPDNEAAVYFTPEKLSNGIHKLRVQAADASANAPGLDYEIHFEVINELTLTELVNYPNPFTSYTRFVFTLTGNELPDVFRIQIMTITGKVIKDIDLLSDPTLRAGKNISSIGWDGTDNFGDPVGNGVYLYRLIARKDGQEIDLRQSGADAFIQRDLGKMYLMR